MSRISRRDKYDQTLTLPCRGSSIYHPSISPSFPWRRCFLQNRTKSSHLHPRWSWQNDGYSSSATDLVMCHLKEYTTSKKRVSRWEKEGRERMPGKKKSAAKVEKASNQQEEWLSLRMRRAYPESCGLAVVTRKINISMYMTTKGSRLP